MDVWYKKKPTDNVWWLDNSGIIGEFIFSFDKVKQFNLFEDYPHALTKAQKTIFDLENPFWRDYFKDRS